MVEITKLDINDVRQRFIELIGEEKLTYIETNNLIKFNIKSFDVYKENVIEINFLETDNEYDDVIHCSICYNEDNKKWYSENCIDYPYVLFNTYKEMKKHIISIEQDIINNGFNLIKLK